MAAIPIQIDSAKERLKPTQCHNNQNKKTEKTTVFETPILPVYKKSDEG